MYEKPKIYSLDGYPSVTKNVGFGTDAIEKTVQLMAKAIDESSQNQRIRKAAINIVYQSPERDQQSEIETLFRWVHENTRYTGDTNGLEILVSPLVALDKIEQGFRFVGDCDDLTMLLLSLAKAIGYKVRLRISAYKGNKYYSHVYGLIRIDGVWTPVEPIEKNAELGWQAPNMTKYQDYDIGV